MIFILCLLFQLASCQYHSWKQANSAAESLLSGLSLAEVVNITFANPVPGVFTKLTPLDGPNGVNTPMGVSGFVAAQTLAMSFDRDLVAAQYAAMAGEFKAKGYGTALGPVTGPLGRSVLDGRLFEGFGTDPYLNGKLFASAVTALQKNGVVSTGKHFLGNEQETNRTGLELISTQADRTSSNIDDRTTHELYLWPWIDGVAAGLGSVMCVMNRVNNTLGCQNLELLDLLKKELAFPGTIVPDATAVMDMFAAIKAGVDLNSDPGNGTGMAAVMQAIKNGTLSEARIRDSALRTVSTQLNYNANMSTYANPLQTLSKVVRQPSTKNTIRQIGAQSICLLKNIRHALPLKNPQSIGVFGANAANWGAGPSWPTDVFADLGDVWPYHLNTGGGSGRTQSPYLVSPLDALTQRAANSTFDINYMAGNQWALYNSGTFPFWDPKPALSQWAEVSDVCLVFINAYSKEGADRHSLSDAAQDDLVNDVAMLCNNTIVVMNTVGARVVDAWINNPNVTAVVNAGLLGEQSGNAILDVLFGDVNPAGRLPYTIAKKQTDYNGAICACCECNYTEALFIDYRHFDQAGITPRFEFGFGLSYTTFNYTEPTASLTRSNFSNTCAAGALVPGGPSGLFDTIATANITVSNTGSLAGDEVVQLYVAYPAGSGEPPRQLRGFTRLKDLAPGSNTTVSFTLQRRDLSIWDVERQCWSLVDGDYRVLFGKSSRMFEGNATLRISA